MKDQNKKKMGYKQFEKLLALAHKKSEILAERCQELQPYFIAYVEYRGDNVEFNNWINKRIIQEQEETQKNEQVNEKV